MNTLLGRVTRHPAGMHCPSWDDAFVSSFFCHAPSPERLLRMVIIDIVINTLLGRVTRHPAGMHCPAGDDAFVSSFVFLFVTLRVRSAVRSRGA